MMGADADIARVKSPQTFFFLLSGENGAMMIVFEVRFDVISVICKSL